MTAPAQPQPGDTFIVAMALDSPTHVLQAARHRLLELLPGVNVQLMAGLAEHIIIRPEETQ